MTRPGRSRSPSRSRPSAGAAGRCATPACRRSCRRTASVHDRPRRAIAPVGRAPCPCSRPLRRPTEVFGSPIVRGHGDGVRRLVADRRRAQRDARRPARRSWSQGAASRRGPGKRTYRIVLGDQATFLPKGSRSDAHARLVVARPEPGESALPRPAVRRRPRGSRDRWHGADPRARDADLADEARSRDRARGARRDRRRRGGNDRRPRRVEDVDPDRRHRAAVRRGGGVRRRRPGREGVLRLRELARRRPRAEDRVPLLRRRVQPGADGAADAHASSSRIASSPCSTRSARRTTSRSATT